MIYTAWKRIHSTHFLETINTNKLKCDCSSLLKNLCQKNKKNLIHISSFILGHSHPRSLQPTVQFSSVQSLSRVRLFATPWIAARRPPCPSPTSRVYSNPCPPSWWCHPAISSSVGPFSSWPQSLPASGSFPMSQLFTWGGQSIGVSASASVPSMNTQDWSPLGWTGWYWVPNSSVCYWRSHDSVNRDSF